VVGRCKFNSTSCIALLFTAEPVINLSHRYIYWPVVLVALSLVFIVFPLPLFYPRAREWFLFSNYRLLLAGVYPVEFRDFFLGDMFCTLFPPSQKAAGRALTACRFADLCTGQRRTVLLSVRAGLAGPTAVQLVELTSPGFLSVLTRYDTMSSRDTIPILADRHCQASGGCSNVSDVITTLPTGSPTLPTPASTPSPSSST